MKLSKQLPRHCTAVAATFLLWRLNIKDFVGLQIQLVMVVYDMFGFSAAEFFFLQVENVLFNPSIKRAIP